MISINDSEEILKKEYNIDNFVYLTKEILLPDFENDIHPVAFNNAVFSRVTCLGESKLCDLTVFEVILKQDVQNQRVTITQEMFRILRGLCVNNAVVAFATADGRNYRISLLTSKYEYDGNKIVKVVSNPRRYSYSLGFGTKTKTAYKFLIAKGKVANLDELITRFSVEVVNKQFYSEVAAGFTQLVGGKRDGKEYEKLLNLYSVVDQNKYAEFAVRLIGRIMFCWFLKEKKSEKGISLIPEDMLLLSNDCESNNYYHNVLEPLFFELLNTNQNRRRDKFGKEEIYKKIPYLNGGLFSPHADDLYKYSSSTQSGAYGVVTIPNAWFKTFYEVLGQYNFTVDENTSYDIELSIDPEMLGRIFENLLAEINPETGENAKKSTGSFYTPRDIVDYMVDSSLLEYLKQKTELSEPRLKALITYGREDDELAILDINEKKKIINAIFSMTVLDPACGSGAFPIGMLQKIVYILQEIDPDASLWFDKATENVGIFIKKEFEKKFNAGSLNYIRKLSVIQNSIFGIDIQPIAVEIARLRCFLSLVIEEKVNDEEYNRGINPLPNLDFKFVIANTLLKLDDSSQGSLFENVEHIKELKAVREEYFNADSERRAELKLEFSDVQKKMFQETISVYGKQASSMYQSLSDWSPFKNEPTDWFDPEWMFGNTSFSIIIANPPYVESRSPNFSDNLKQKLQKQIKATYNKTDSGLIPQGSDLLIYFYERAIQFAGDNGIISYITSNGWLNNEYGHKFQKFLLRHTDVMSIIDTDFKYFESANINTIITFYKGKCKPTKEIAFATHHKKFADSQFGIIKENLDTEDLTVSVKDFSKGADFKWGIFFNTDVKFFELMEILRIKGNKLVDVGFSLGQGLNLIERDSHIVNKVAIDSLSLDKDCFVPFMNKDETGYYIWQDSATFLLKEYKLNESSKKELLSLGYKLFSINSNTRQTPKLIMPRGIGEKHYCSFNEINGFSDSGVDIYSTYNKDADDLLRIWLFCNSSICWLIREKFGRKNLGGGMLKAEAIDLKDKYLFFKFENMQEIKDLYLSLKDYKVKNCLDEINEIHHKKIDELIFDYLGLSLDMRTYVIEALYSAIYERTKKSKQKV